MIGFNFILCSSILAGSVLSNRPHSHLTHVEMKVDLQARNSALDAAAFLESAVTYIECQLAQGLTQAALALGINKGSTTTCIAPGSSSSVTPILAVPAAIKPAAQVPAAVAAIVGVTVPTSVPIVNAAIVIAGNVDSIIAAVPVSTTPIPAVMPNPVTSSSVSVSISTTSTSSATASVSTGDPCISTNPDVCLQQTLALTAHNLARAKHHAPPLLWSNALAASALEWAENCQWVHSGGSLYPPSYVYGENLYASTLDEPQTSMTIAVQAYINEEVFYNYSNPVYSDESGHFTQVVWKATEQVGCAIINCDLPIFDMYTNLSAFSVCEYYPSGNYFGSFAENVLKP